MCDDHMQNQDEEGMDRKGTTCSNKAYPTKPPSAGEYFK